MFSFPARYFDGLAFGSETFGALGTHVDVFPVDQAAVDDGVFTLPATVWSLQP